jgi:hypothetical protein
LHALPDRLDLAGHEVAMARDADDQGRGQHTGAAGIVVRHVRS